MRLNKFDPSKINVRRGSSGGRGRMPGGKMGCGTIVIVLIGALVFGVDPAQMMGTMEEMQGGQSQSAPQDYNVGESAEEICADNAYSMEACNALASLNETWETRFAQAGVPFEQPGLVFYSRQVNSACGGATSASGPFYCPGDQDIYIDTSFYDTLQRKLGAGGDFARYYVMAHEYGHHIQTITGISAQIRSAQSGARTQAEANQLQVRMELQADCYAGVWASLNRNLIEQGDLEEGMTAASAIGDDALTGGRVHEDNFTHGTSRQRMEALRLGLQTGDDAQCDRITQVR